MFNIIKIMIVFSILPSYSYTQNEKLTFTKINYSKKIEPVIKKNIGFSSIVIPKDAGELKKNFFTQILI